MGVGSSKQTLALSSAKLPESERYYGLENFGNTCYANSVLQALYFCKPLRQRAIEHGEFANALAYLRETSRPERRVKQVAKRRVEARIVGEENAGGHEAETFDTSM